MSYRRLRQVIIGSLLAVPVAVCGGDPSRASSPEQGKRLALTHCARCHSIDKVSQSPLKIAPPFRTLHERYPVENLAEALAEGIRTGHPTMPEYRLDPGQVADVIAYLKSLER